MDRLTHISVTNAIKELDALHKLALSRDFEMDEIADWIQEISWQLTNIFQRRKYNSDEFQCRLIKLVEGRKKKKNDTGE